MSTWRLQIRDPRGNAHDVLVSGDARSSTSQLHEELDGLGFHARPLSAHGRPLASSETLADTELENGDVIACGRIDLLIAPPATGWYVVSVAGPDAGRWQRLEPDKPVIIGRSDAGGLSLDDPLLSASHCRLTLHEDAVEIADLGSTNGTFVEGVEVHDPVVHERGQFFQAGSSTLTVVSIERDDLAVLGDLDGPDRVFPRQYRRALPELPDRVDAPKAREPDDGSSAAGWWRSAIPVVTGAGFAIITGRWIFLLIMAVAPVIFTVDAMRRRRRTAARDTRRQERFETELAVLRTRVIELRRVERQRLRDSSAIGGLAALAAEARLADLWQRSPGDGDFLHLAIGLAPMPSRIMVAGPDIGLPEVEWGTPVTTDLRITGSLAIVGEPNRRTAVARGLLLTLAAQHSPADLHVSILTRDEDGDRWGFARWLPHCFSGDRGCRIGTEPDGRAALFSSITQLLETRREVRTTATDGRDAQPLPIHVVVVDDTDLIPPGELAELLQDGPANGIVGITLDSRLAPEGVGATLTLSNASDTSVFQSRHQPRVEGVAVAEMSALTADRAARRLAGLRPTTSESSELAGGVVHLVDVLDGASNAHPRSPSRSHHR